MQDRSRRLQRHSFAVTSTTTQPLSRLTHSSMRACPSSPDCVFRKVLSGPRTRQDGGQRLIASFPVDTRPQGLHQSGRVRHRIPQLELHHAACRRGRSGGTIPCPRQPTPTILNKCMTRSFVDLAIPARPSHLRQAHQDGAMEVLSYPIRESLEAHFVGSRRCPSQNVVVVRETIAVIEDDLQNSTAKIANRTPPRKEGDVAERGLEAIHPSSVILAFAVI